MANRFASRPTMLMTATQTPRKVASRNDDRHRNPVVLWFVAHGVVGVFAVGTVAAAFSLWRSSSAYGKGWPEITDPILVPVLLALVFGRALWSGVDFIEARNPRLVRVRAITGLSYVGFGAAVCRLSPQVGPVEAGHTWCVSIRAFLISVGIFGLVKVRFSYLLASACVVVRATAGVLLPSPTDTVTRLFLWEFTTSASVQGWLASLSVAAISIMVFARAGTSWGS
jgi:hypothetical protein